MQKLLPLILLVVAALVAAFYLLGPSDSADEPTNPAAAEQNAVEAADGLAQEEGAPEAAQLENAPGVERSELASEDAPHANGLTAGNTGFVVARLVDVAGNPLGGNQLVAREHSMFGSGRELSSATSQEDGSVRLEVPAGDRVRLAAYGPYWAQNTMELAALRPEEEVAIGEIILIPADRVVGMVKDANGNPSVLAKVSLVESGSEMMIGNAVSHQTTTDADGRYEFGGIASGSYRLRALGHGFAPGFEDPVVIDASGKDVEINLHLGEGRKVTGVVLDADSRPIANALVGPQRSIFDSDLGPTPDNPRARMDGVQTDAQGRFELAGLDESIEQLVVRREGFATNRVMLPEEGKDVVVKMRRSLSLAGQVVDHRGDAVAEVEVRLEVVGEELEVWEMGRREVGRAISDASGQFRISGLRAGSYQLSAYALAGQILDAPVELLESIDNHEVRLEPGRHLVIKVEDEFGKFISGADIDIHEASVVGLHGGMEIEFEHDSSSSEDGDSSSTRVRRGGTGFQATTDKVGHAVFFGVPEGDYVATVNAEGYAKGKLSFERLADHQNETMVLPRAAQLVVRVVSPTFTPQPGVEIYLKRLDKESDLITEQSDTTGRVVWPHLEAGRYEVGYREAEAAMTGMIFMGMGGPKKKKTHPVQEVDLIAQAALEVQVEVRDLALVDVTVKRSGVVAGGVDAWLEKPSRGPGPGGADFNRPSATKTDARGVAQLPAKEPGKYELVVRGGQQAPQVRQPVTLVAGQQQFEVEIPGGEVVGNLFAEGRPLPGATLTLVADNSEEEGATRTRGLAIMMVDDGDGMNVQMSSGNPNDASAVSDGDGDFRFTDVPPGTWKVECRARGYERWSSDPFTMHDDGTVDLGTQRLVKGASIHGTDLNFDPDNDQTASMFGMASILQLQDENGETIDVGLTKSDGTYRFTDLKAGTYILQRGNYTSEPIQVSGGEQKTHDLPKE